jgi:hypothetical protein
MNDTVFLISRLGGVVVSVLATGPKSRGSKPGLGDILLRAMKIRSTSSFGWVVKPDVPRRKILWHVKDPMTISDTGMQNSHSFVHSSYSLPDVFAAWISRELWWTSQEFSPAGIIIIALHSHISPRGMNNTPAVGRSSET